MISYEENELLIQIEKAVEKIQQYLDVDCDDLNQLVDMVLSFKKPLRAGNHTALYKSGKKNGYRGCGSKKVQGCRKTPEASIKIIELNVVSDYEDRN
jgi:hypothetical protein